MEVEVRRLQRLGSGSIVVTIPKQWASKLGLEPGMNVMLVSEDDSIRIVPLQKVEEPEVILDLSKNNERLLLGVPICTYLSGLKRVVVRLPRGRDDLLLALMGRAMNFVGLQIFSVTPGEARVEVLLDHEKIDHIRLIRNMGTVLEGLTKLIAESLETGSVDMKRATLYRQELLRELYMAIRYLLSTHPPDKSIVAKELTALTASYLGLVVDLLYEALTLLDTQRSRIPESRSDVEELARLYRRLAGSSVQFVLAIAQPAPSKVEALLGGVAGLREAADRVAERLESPLGGLLLGRLMDVLRILTLAGYILTCRSLLEYARGKG